MSTPVQNEIIKTKEESQARMLTKNVYIWIWKEQSCIGLEFVGVKSAWWQNTAKRRREQESVGKEKLKILAWWMWGVVMWGCNASDFCTRFSWLDDVACSCKFIISTLQWIPRIWTILKTKSKTKFHKFRKCLSIQYTDTAAMISVSFSMIPPFSSILFFSF